jgi:hypothetical protein
MANIALLARLVLFEAAVTYVKYDTAIRRHVLTIYFDLPLQNYRFSFYILAR